MREQTMGMIFIFIVGMAFGSALNGYYHSYKVDELNASILEFNLAVETTFKGE